MNLVDSATDNIHHSQETIESDLTQVNTALSAMHLENIQQAENQKQVSSSDKSVELVQNTLEQQSVESEQSTFHMERDNHASSLYKQEDSGREVAENSVEVWTDVMEVPKQAVGFIIGKGGETIKELSFRSGAHIEVERRDIDAMSTSRLFRIQGTPSAIQLAKQLILEKVAGVIVGPHVSSVTSTGSIQSELWIPMDRVGVIIGVGGQTIKSLEEQSQATIVVHNEKVNAVGEKLVTIVGRPQEVHIAETLIQEIIQRPSRAMNAALYSTVRLFVVVCVFVFQ